MPSPEAHSAWREIGRLNSAGYDWWRLCTAVLLQFDVVLSATHCMTRPDGGPAEPAELKFVAGWFRGTNTSVGEVATVSVRLAWRDATAPGETAPGSDIALIRLAAPIRDVEPPTRRAPVPGKGVRVLGDRAGRPHALSDSGTCLHRREGNARRTDCVATFGTSGAPVLQQRDGAWRVVGIASAIGNGQTHFAPWRPLGEDALMGWSPECPRRCGQRTPPSPPPPR